MSSDYTGRMDYAYNMNKVRGSYAMRLKWFCVVVKSLAHDYERDERILGGHTLGEWADVLDGMIDVNSTHSYLNEAQQPCITDEGKLVDYIYRNFGVRLWHLEEFTLAALDDFPSGGTPSWSWVSGALGGSMFVRRIGSLNPYQNDLHIKLPWEAREYMRRFVLHEYQPVPWEDSLSKIPGHFAHVSKEDKSMVAFTENPEKGARDIQVRVRPGRYLKRFYPYLSDDEIRDLVCAMTGEYDLKFAKTADEIQKVYENGPRSCMSHPPTEFLSYCHPVRVYGDSDLQLAYLTNKGGNKPKARALVWPEKKKIGRIYGDIERLRNMLFDAGYEQSSGDGSSLVGARIRKIMCKEHNVYVMPYIDGTQCARNYDDEYLAISHTHDAEYSANLTNGLVEECEETHEYYCDQCEEGCDDYTPVHVSSRNTESWCQYCVDNRAAFCNGDDVHIHESEATNAYFEVRRSYGVTYEEETVSRWYAETNCYLCDGLEEYVHYNIQSYQMDHGETWSKIYFDEHGVAIDGVYYDKDNVPDKQEELDLDEVEVTLEAAE